MDSRQSDHLLLTQEIVDMSVDQPFLLPDTSVISSYGSVDPEEDCNGVTYPSMYPEQRYALDHHHHQVSPPVEQASYWDSCASLEDVESAVYSSSSGGCLTPPVIEIHRLDTGDRIGPLSDISGHGEPVVSSTEGHKKKSGRKGKKKSAYKHIPHREKPCLV